MRNFTRLFSLCIVVGLLSIPALAQTTDTYVFRTLMLPANEVPPITGLDASGTAIIRVHVVRDSAGNITSGLVDFQVDYRFPANVTITGLHIHPAPAGTNGPVAIGTNISGTNPIADTSAGAITRSVLVTPSNTAAFNALVGLLSQPDQFYANLHTTVNPGGVIRGQLVPADVLVVRGTMSPANEVPPITGFDASASAFVTVYATRDATGAITSGTTCFDVRYRFPGEVTLTGLHIHPGAASVNGGVVISSGLASTPDPGAGTISRCVEVTTAAGLAALEGLFRNPDQYYINMHTSVYPGGVIRSQLQRTDVITLRADLSPANEVPPVTGLNASGAGKVAFFVTRDAAGEITSGTALFDVTAQFPGRTEFTGLHIHPGVAGTNGGVVISSGVTGTSPVVSEDGNVNIMRFVDIAPTDTAALNALRGIVANPANYYLNLHTTVNPGGVIRGQLTLPGEPELRVTLEPGYYVAETTLAPGQPTGVWGMIVLPSGFALSGGFNLGGGFGAAGGVPGFGAFYIAEPKSVNFTLATQALPGEAGPSVRVRILDLSGRVIGESATGAPSGLPVFQPGFYVVELRSQAGAGTFQLGMNADVFHVGGIAGGYAAPGITGFGGFNIGARQEVTIQLFGKKFYGPFGSGNLILRLKDASGAVRAVSQ